MTEKESSLAHSKCNSMLEFAVTRNKRIQQLVDSIESLGCQIPKDFFACRPCDAEISGGFTIESSQSKGSAYSPQVLMCENHMLDKESFENTMAHELVHAYDICRAKIDFKDCTQHACTEIRASSLSGECNILHEMFRGTYTKFAAGQQDCVRRRATKSVSMNPNCQAIADKAVSEAFAKCHADEMPLNSDKKTSSFK